MSYHAELRRRTRHWYQRKWRPETRWGPCLFATEDEAVQSAMLTFEMFLNVVDVRAVHDDRPPTHRWEGEGSKGKPVAF